jgi:phosphoribosyl 1,2-cyclic phosphodiesterase
MDIQAICHSCLHVKEGSTSLLIDPWIKGTVFLGGWALQPAPLDEVLSNLPRIDFIYLTHEHSDHTHIGSLKDLFAGPARSATLLIPRFMTPRFLTWLRKVFPSRPRTGSWQAASIRFIDLLVLPVSQRRLDHRVAVPRRFHVPQQQRYVRQGPSPS